MIISIKNDNIDVNVSGKIYHDLNGNILLKIDTIYYYLLINNENDIEFIKINNDNCLIQSNIPKNLYIKWNNLTNKKSLKNKILLEMNKRDIYDNEYDRDNDDETYDHNLNRSDENYIHNYITNQDDYINDDEYNDNIDYDIYFFKLKYYTNTLIECSKLMFETKSNYSIELINDKNDIIIFKTSNCNNNPFNEPHFDYKVSFYLSGKIKLHTYNENSYTKYYNIEYKNDNIVMNRIYN